MELFLPSLFVFLVATIIVTFLLPRLSPLIIVILAAGLLSVGVYHHFTIFWSEYKQSTWQDQLKIFAPGIMLAVIILYVIFSIIMFLTGGQVPIPSMPKMELPSAESATNNVTAAINNMIQPFVPNTIKSNNTSKNNTNAPKNNVTRSFVATI